MLRRAVCVTVLMISMAGLAFAETAELTMWPLPVARSFPVGLATDGQHGYVSATGGMEVRRLDPQSNSFRSWGVGAWPEDVVVVNGVPFCTSLADNLITFFNPDGLGVSTDPIPFPDVAPGEIHRGLDTDDGRVVLWIQETAVPGFLRYTYDPAGGPMAVGDPTETPVNPQQEIVQGRVEAVEHETFSYDTASLPEPQSLAPANSQPRFTEWRLPLGDDERLTDLAVSDEGIVWISAGLPFLFRFDPGAGTIQLLEVAVNAQVVKGLLPAGDGSIWYGNAMEGSIGHLNPEAGLSEVWRVLGTQEIYDLAFGDGNAIWYTDRVGDAIVRLSPADGTAVVFDLPEGSEPLQLELSEDGTVWFSAGLGNYIGRLRLMDE